MYKLSSTTVLTVPSLAKLRFATTLTRTARRALGPPKSNVSVVWMRGRLERPSSVLRTCHPGTATVLPTLLSIVTLHPPTLRMSAKTDIRPPQGGGASRMRQALLRHSRLLRARFPKFSEHPFCLFGQLG